MKKTLTLLALVLSILVAISHSAEALTVSPAKIEVTLDPGKTVNSKVEIFNDQDETKTFYLTYENFESRGDSGAPYFIGRENGLATWVQTEPSVTIGPGKRVNVPYSISVPAGTKPGGYFAAIFFGSQPPETKAGGEVSVGGKVGILVLLRVSGDVEESAGIVDFGAEGGGRFFSALPVTLKYSFNNVGGDRVVPNGEIVIKNTLQFKSATLLANEREGSVLPSSTRGFDVVWGEKVMGSEDAKLGFFATALMQIKDFHLGWYRANLDLTWGDSAQKGQNSFNFFIIPWQLLTLVLILLMVVVFGGRRWLKRHNRIILARANK